MDGAAFRVDKAPYRRGGIIQNRREKRVRNYLPLLGGYKAWAKKLSGGLGRIRRDLDFTQQQLDLSFCQRCEGAGAGS